MMAGRAARLRIDAELLLELQAEIDGGFDAGVRLGVLRNVLVAIAEVEDFFEWPEMLFRSFMTLQTPGHGVALCLIDHLHLVHITVAALAGNTPVHVSGVIEVNIVRRFMNPHPLDWLAVITRVVDIHRLMERSKFRTVLLNVLVAVPAGISGWNVRGSGNINEGVAVAAVQTKLIYVNLVGERDRLCRLISNSRRLRRCVVCESEGDTCQSRAGTKGNLQRKQVRPAWEKICHGMGGSVRLF